MAFDAQAETIPCVPLPRTMDPTLFETVANSPQVRPALGRGSDPLSFAAALSNPDNFALGDSRGGFIFEKHGPGRYELHTLFSNRTRGAKALDLAAQAFRFMFIETDCAELVTRVPANLRHADVMARLAGFRAVWTMRESWPGPDGPVALRLFTLTLDEWMQRDRALVAEGEAFHRVLASKAREAGWVEPLHPTDDEVHERAAGMAALMAKAGNHRKAIWAYGRWALLAGYRPIQLISESPAVYDTGNALVAVRNGHLEVIQWLPPQ